MRHIFYTIVLITHCAHLAISAGEVVIMPNTIKPEHLQKIEITAFEGNRKLITCPKGTLFDHNGWIYEYKDLCIQRTGENIRAGIIGQAVEDAGKINNTFFYKTKNSITFISENNQKNAFSAFKTFYSNL